MRVQDWELESQQSYYLKSGYYDNREEYNNDKDCDYCGEVFDRSELTSFKGYMYCDECLKEKESD